MTFNIFILINSLQSQFVLTISLSFPCKQHKYKFVKTVVLRASIDVFSLQVNVQAQSIYLHSNTTIYWPGMNNTAILVVFSGLCERGIILTTFSSVCETLHIRKIQTFLFYYNCCCVNTLKLNQSLQVNYDESKTGRIRKRNNFNIRKKIIRMPRNQLHISHQFYHVIPKLLLSSVGY